MGFVSDTIELVREMTNEPSADAKYGDARIIKYLEWAWAQEVPSLWANADGPSTIRWEFTIVADTIHYVLPPYVGEIIQIAKLDSNRNVEWMLRPRARSNPAGPGYEVNGGILTFTPTPQLGETFTMHFMPSGEIKLCEGPLGAASTTSVLNLGTPTVGTRDGRVANAYAGYTIRVTDTNGRVEERQVVSSAFDGDDHTATVGAAFTVTCDTNSTYEMVPIVGITVQRLVAIAASIAILQNEGIEKREMAMARAHRVEKDALVLRMSNLDSVVGQHFRGDVEGNHRYGLDALDMF